MSTHYKLHYFPVRGRAECIRYIFAYAAVPYEEKFIEMFQEWPGIKSNYPFGTIPYLEIDGGKEWIGQSLTIARYLARQFEIGGKTPLEQAKAEMYVEGTSDLYSGYGPLIRAVISGDKNQKDEAVATFKEKYFNPYLDRYTKFLKANGGVWFVGNSLTWADLVIGEFMDKIVKCFDPTALDKHSELKEFVSRVNKIPQIAKRIAERPNWPG